ncbi:MAG: VWA domain-containing protein [Gemmatimonadota bacterium]
MRSLAELLMGSGAPILFAAGLAATAAGLVILVAAARTQRDREALADAGLLERLVPGSRPGRVWLSLALVSTAAGMIAAAAVSSWSGRSPAASTGPETVIVLDASNSMMAGDADPDRITQQRRLATEMAARLPGRLGVVFFAGRAYVLSPLTGDRDATLMFVQSVDPSAVGRGGTALAAGISQALDVLVGGSSPVRRVLLFSDGESTFDNDALDGVLDRASRAGVRVHTVGLGTTAGSAIPLAGLRTGVQRQERVPDAFMRDTDGEIVISRLAEDQLRDVARRTGGVYVPGTDEGIAALLPRLAGQLEAERASAPVLLLVLLAFALLFSDAYLVRKG